MAPVAAAALFAGVLGVDLVAGNVEDWTGFAELEAEMGAELLPVVADVEAAGGAEEAGGAGGLA